MRSSVWLATLFACGVATSVPTNASAQQKDMPPPQKGLTERQKQLLQSIHWENGPTEAKIGSVASIKVPAGYQFTNATGARAYLELLGNPPDSESLGALKPVDSEDDWLVVFSYSDVGYVKDDEKDKIDSKAILESIKAGTEEANKQRARMGTAPLEVVGWETPPFYNSQTQRLSWAVRARSEGRFIINYNTRILGRGGVMSANLIVDPEDLPKTLPIFDKLLTGYAYVPGQKYSEFRSGDKVAEYGLTALMVGGGLAVAAKTGLLAKLLKPLLVVGAVIVGAIAKFYRAIFGRKKSNENNAA